MLEVHHSVAVADAHAHLLRIRTTLRWTGGGPLPSPLTVFMPVWTPGSYLVREYARHVEGLRASAIVGAGTAGKSEALPCRKVRKNAWQIEAGAQSQIQIEYQLYANELTVRTNHVDSTHAYWNGAATFLTVEHSPGQGAVVAVDLPDDWTVATALTRVAGPQMHTFLARTFDELCDSPFECGKLIERSFTAHGKLHRLAAWDGADARTVDWDKLSADTKTIVESEARLLAGAESAEDALPYERFLFLWHISPRGQGGLEHRDSTTLMARPSAFTTRAGYLDVLSLIAHEFFHVWNVKRIRPVGLTPYRYEEENYTRLLWWFEGSTSYYAWRVLRLANLCTAAEYLAHLADEMARLEDTPGALVHALEDASYDAWIKAYRPDENSLNSTISYYLKGEIVCALLDLELRQQSGRAVSLDDVLRRLNRQYAAWDIPVPEHAFPSLVAEIAGSSLDDFFARFVRGTEPLPLRQMLGYVGLTLERARAGGPPVSLGARLKLDGGRIVVDAIPRGGAAHRAGLDVRDEIVAVAGRRVAEGRLELPLTGLTPGEHVAMVVARDGWLRTIDLVLDPPPPNEAKIVPQPNATQAARTNYEAWLGEPFPLTAGRASNPKSET